MEHRPRTPSVLLVLCVVAVVVVLFAIRPASALHSGAVPDFYSPLPPEPTPDITWITTAGGTFTDKGCSGIALQFPSGALEQRSNAHCSHTTFRTKAPSGLQDVKTRMFIGVWSGYGEVTEFLKPVSVRISIGSLPEESRLAIEHTPGALSLCTWIERSARWQCTAATLDERSNTITASLQSLVPTRNFDGWDGNSLISLFAKPNKSRAAATATPTSVSNP